MSILSSIGDLFSGSSAAAAAQAQAQAIQQAYQQYSDLANKAAGSVTSYGGQASDAFKNLMTGANAGSSAYADALGVNGPEGLARARASFGGMVQPDINMALDAMTRQAKAQGVASGNVLADESKYAANELNNRYFNYVGMLNPYLNQQTQATGGLANTFMNTGNQLANISTNQGNAALGVGNLVGQATAQGIMAPTLGASNFLNFALQAAKAGAGAMSGGLGGLASAFGGGGMTGGQGLGSSPTATGRLY